MNILSLELNQVKAFVDGGLMREESIKHWRVCKALSEGKKIDEVAEEFKISSRNVDQIKAKKCYSCH